MRKITEKSILALRFFARLPPASRARLLRSAEIKAVPKGAVLWRRGERAAYAHVVLGGRVGLFDALEDDRATVIDMYRAGDAITGAPVLLTKATYMFSGKALDDSTVLLIPVDAYRRYLRSDRALLFGAALAVATAWRRIVVQLHNMKRLPANRRLGSYLLGLTDRQRGAATVRLADDQLIVASVLGVTRESLSRSFAQLRAHGVHKRGRTVTIADVKQLRAYCTHDLPD